MLLRRQADLMPEGTDKGLRAFFAMDFKIERAEVTSLPTEWDVEVEAEGRGRHDKRLNPWGLEKFRARTISISSAGDFPRLRMCVCHDRCWRNDSKSALTRSGLIRVSHSRTQP